MDPSTAAAAQPRVYKIPGLLSTPREVAAPPAAAPRVHKVTTRELEMTEAGGFAPLRASAEDDSLWFLLQQVGKQAMSTGWETLEPWLRQDPLIPLSNKAGSFASQ